MPRTVKGYKGQRELKAAGHPVLRGTPPVTWNKGIRSEPWDLLRIGLMSVGRLSPLGAVLWLVASLGRISTSTTHESYAIILLGDSTQRYWLDEGLSDELGCWTPDDVDFKIIGGHGDAVRWFMYCKHESVRKVGFLHHWGVS